MNNLQENKIEILRDLDVFCDLENHEMARIAGICGREKFNKGDILFEDTSPGHALFIIISGRVKVEVEAITPNETLALSIIKPGEILGEFAIIDSKPRSATAECLEETEVLVIDGRRLTEIFEKYNHIGYIVMRNIARTICHRIRRTNRLLLSSLRYRI